MTTSFAEATAVRKTGSHTYEADFVDGWCIGTVPNGGYVTSTILKVAALHFTTTLSSQNQPHTLNIHLEFIRRTSVGHATFHIKDIKLGRSTSIIHITLCQHGQEEVLAYITQTNFSKEEGKTLNTGWSLSPASPTVDLARLKEGRDGNWIEVERMPFPGFRKASQNLRFAFPRKGQCRKSVADQWIRFRSGERFTNDSLGFVADMFPQLTEGYLVDSSNSTPNDSNANNANSTTVSDAADPHTTVPFDEYLRAIESSKTGGKHWYPTLVLNLEVKKALPVEGVEWLFARVATKSVRNGRYDLEVVIFDEGGEMVALSHHVTMVLGAGRNTAVRRNGNGSGGESKL